MAPIQQVMVYCGSGYVHSLRDQSDRAEDVLLLQLTSILQHYGIFNYASHLNVASSLISLDQARIH